MQVQLELRSAGTLKREDRGAYALCSARGEFEELRGQRRRVTRASRLCIADHAASLEVLGKSTCQDAGALYEPRTHSQECPKQEPTSGMHSECYQERAYVISGCGFVRLLTADNQEIKDADVSLACTPWQM